MINYIEGIEYLRQYIFFAVLPFFIFKNSGELVMNFNSYFELYLKQGVLDFVNSHVEESVNKVNVDSIFIEDREGLEFKCYVILTINDSYKYTVECDGDLEKLDNLFKIVGSNLPVEKCASS